MARNDAGPKEGELVSFAQPFFATREEWAGIEEGRLETLVFNGIALTPEVARFLQNAPAAAMAIANHALPPEDPRKITQELARAVGRVIARDKTGDLHPNSDLGGKLIKLNFALFTLLPPHEKR